MKLKLVWIAAIFLALVAGATAAQNSQLLIMGGSNHDRFLGCLNCNQYDSNSVMNQYSQHGWANRYGTWNQYGEYAGRYSNTSACNEHASNAPIIVDRAGNSYGRLTLNRYATGSVCGLSGSTQICNALRVMCSGAR